MLTVAVVLTTHSVVRANLLDVTACTWPFLLPFFLPTILASSASVPGGAAGMPRVSPLAAGMHNAYSWALVLMLVVAVVTGYGRREGAGDDYDAGAK